MPTQYLIRFDRIPKKLLDHIQQRILDRKIDDEDLAKWHLWAQTNPVAPEGDWYKDFGSYKLVGTGPYPKTVLTREMQPWGVRLAYLKLVEDFLGDRC
jgi:hypothetical protein